MRSYIDIRDVVAALRETVPEFVRAVRDIDDPNATAVGTWTAADVAAHIIDVNVDHQNVALGKGTEAATSEEITALNQRLLDARPDRDPQSLADTYEKETSKYFGILDAIDGDPIIAWTNLKMPLSSVLAAELAELLIHGWDITRSQGHPWSIDPYRAGLSAKGISPMMADYVDTQAAAGLNATYELKLRGEWTQHYVFTDGELSIEEPSDRRVDVHISAAPVPFMLVGYGRISQWGPILKGQVMSWGRKPLLALKFANLLRNP